MTLEHKAITELVRCLEGSDCEEFHLAVGDVELTLRRRVDRDAPPLPQRQRDIKADQAEAGDVERSVDGAPPKRPAPAQVGFDTTVSGTPVAAPMSGTFYRRPSPEEEPFVEVGSRVAVGDPLCMIEVMKLFSTVYAELAGEVSAIAVEDGAAVAQDQPLFAIAPEGRGA